MLDTQIYQSSELKKRFVIVAPFDTGLFTCLRQVTFGIKAQGCFCNHVFYHFNSPMCNSRHFFLVNIQSQSSSLPNPYFFPPGEFYLVANLYIIDGYGGSLAGETRVADCFGTSESCGFTRPAWQSCASKRANRRTNGLRVIAWRIIFILGSFGALSAETTPWLTRSILKVTLTFQCR